MNARGRSRRVASKTSSLEPLGDFEELYRSMAQSTLVFFTRRTADPEIGRDLWAETWARAYESRGRFRGSTRAEREGWVMGIGRKVLASYYKRGAVHRRAMGRLELERPSLGDADLERLERAAGLGELRDELGRALADIPGPQQEALRLRIVDGHSYPEVARRMGVSEEAARARVSRGLRTLAGTVDIAADDFEHGDWT
ncbi:MAG TPA: RNA polymerase sigma factor [Solirubrobacteraceae bacterium]|nr:RNA polymerase sigma factor [Solirubrobacteraceae bacterium]